MKHLSLLCPLCQKGHEYRDKAWHFPIHRKRQSIRGFGDEQSLSLGFKYDAVKAYADTRIAMIPTSVPYEAIKLNRPFAFDIVGQEGAVLIHGRVRTLDV